MGSNQLRRAKKPKSAQRKNPTDTRHMKSCWPRPRECVPAGGALPFDVSPGAPTGARRCRRSNPRLEQRLPRCVLHISEKRPHAPSLKRYGLVQLVFCLSSRSRSVSFHRPPSMQMTRYSLRLGSHVQHLVASVAYKRRFRCYWSFTLSSYSIVPPEGRRELWLFQLPFRAAAAGRLPVCLG